MTTSFIYGSLCIPPWLAEESRSRTGMSHACEWGTWWRMTWAHQPYWINPVPTDRQTWYRQTDRHGTDRQMNTQATYRPIKLYTNVHIVICCIIQNSHTYTHTHTHHDVILSKLFDSKPGLPETDVLGHLTSQVCGKKRDSNQLRASLL